MAVLIRDEDFGGVAGAAAAGVLRGHTLREWWNSFPGIAYEELADSRPDARMRAFYTEIPIDDQPMSAMGCLQLSTFERRAAPGAEPVSLAGWVAENFLRRARWENADGTRGGFLYRPALLLLGGEHGEVRRAEDDLEVRVSDAGTRYRGMVLRLDLLDYMRAIPVLGKYNRWLEPLNREAGYMVLHEDYLQTAHPAPEGCVEQYCFGYSVSPWTVMPTPAAYGPGRFHSAYKQFRFFLLEDGRVQIEVLFIVAPRCTKVLNILGVDPVFGSARVIDWLTLGKLGVLERAQTGVNHYAMGHHARVHDHLLCGMRSIWEETNWQAVGRQMASSSSSGQ